MEATGKAPGGGIGVLHAPSHPTHIYREVGGMGAGGGAWWLLK